MKGYVVTKYLVMTIDMNYIDALILEKWAGQSACL